MAKSKAPAFQFYPGDWLRDTALRTCSVAARGLWIDMICIMHQGSPYGHLTINGVSIDQPALARMVGCSGREISAWMAELEAVKVFSRGENGVIYSRRMVIDEENRRKRAEGGKLGGNPSLKVNGKVNGKVNLNPTIDLTPSSSSSSSSSTFSNTPYPLLGFSQAFQMAWDSWPAERRTKRETAQSAWQDSVVRLAFRFDGDPRQAEDWLLARVREFVKSPKAAGRYCTGIANWLIEGRYDDAREAWQDSGEDSAPQSTYGEIAPV